MRLRHSFWALLAPSDTETPQAVLERVRLAMRCAVHEHLGREAEALQQRLAYAQDLESLWYLRPELMDAIAAACGEAQARNCLLGLTALFRGHHPGAAASRSGRLGAGGAGAAQPIQRTPPCTISSKKPRSEAGLML